MIDKLQPRKLDKDSDHKIVQKTSMTDALNVYIDERLSGAEGDAGVIKPVLGTSRIISRSDTPVTSSTNDTAGGWRVLGTVTDEVTGVVYFFVFSGDASESGVYAWDPHGVLPVFVANQESGEDNTVVRILTGSIFNFSSDAFVKADIVYSPPSEDRGETSLPENDAVLYFTDDMNEPRKINVYRALKHREDFATKSNFDKNDFICACPKVPMGNIDYVFEFDESVKVSNFEKTSGFQFAVQGVYHDGTTTAIGPYSTIAFPPSIVNRGARPIANTLQHNLCKVYIPDLPEEIKDVKILARQGNSSNFIEIDEVPNIGEDEGNSYWSNGNERFYKFYNNRVAIGVSPSEVSKIFDNVPRKAKSQAAINNRLVYGNFLEGYDPAKLTASIPPVFKERPSEGVDFSINAKPSIIRAKTSGQNLATTNTNTHSSGIELDVNEIPQNLDANTVIEFAFTFASQQGYHVFDSNQSYSQTHMRGAMAGDLAGYPKFSGSDSSLGPIDSGNGPRRQSSTGLTTVGSSHARRQELVTGNYTRFTRYENPNENYNSIFGSSDGVTSRTFAHKFLCGDYGSDTGGILDENRDSIRNFFGYNAGVGARVDENGAGLGAYPNNAPKYKTSLNGTTGQYRRAVYWGSGTNNNKIHASFGSSAAAPFIIPGGQVSFRIKFRTTEELGGDARNRVANFIADSFGTASGSSDTAFEIIDSFEKSFIHEVDLNLQDRQVLTPAQLKYITAVGDMSNEGDKQYVVNDMKKMANQVQRRIPAGYFILNRASVKFGLRRGRTYDDNNSAYGSAAENLRLCIEDVTVPSNGIFTCIRKMDPASPWWALSPSTVDQYRNNGSFSGPVPWDDWSSRVWNGSQGATNLSFGLECLNTSGDPVLFNVGGKFLGRILHEGQDGGSEVSFWANVMGDGDEFRFCVLDGAGGPGGFNPGDNSAFAVYGNGSQGSVPGQVLFTHFGVYDKRTNASNWHGKKQVIEDIQRLLCWNNRLHQSYGVSGRILLHETNTEVFGIGNDDVIGQIPIGDNNFVRAGSPQASAANIPTFRDIWSQQADLDSNTASGGDNYPAVAVHTGPFFTGKIGMHPIVSPPLGGDLRDIANKNSKNGGALHRHDVWGETDEDLRSNISNYSFLNGEGGNTLNAMEGAYRPPGITQTTVLPYVFFNDLKSETRGGEALHAQTYPPPILWAEEVTTLNDFLTWDERYTYNMPLHPDPYGYADPGNGGGYSNNHPGYRSISFAGFNPHVEIVSSKTITTSDTGKPLMSFKANANHEFGVVYFDERGRRGPVQLLESVFVPGFGADGGRGEIAGVEGGPVNMSINVSSPPPDWAHHWKIVYSKNTTISDFFQYSTEGAYAVETDDNNSELSGRKIYMSLNYLQGHPISYSDAWGARSQDGSPVVFQPKQGDKLRIISYKVIVGNSTQTVFPSDYVFDVIGVESLGDNPETNPLMEADKSLEDQEFANSKQGLFLVIRDNPENDGFALSNIENDASNWFNNVIFEIFRPMKGIDADKRLYFELGPTYKIGKEGNNLVHLNENNENAPVEVDQGDVFFRLSAVNLKPSEGNGFVNLITEEEGEVAELAEGLEPPVRRSEPNFRSIYTEASSASDLFESEATSIGRPAKVDRNDRERRREASLIHSDRDIPKKRKLGYSSFNPSQADDKDLDPAPGPINYMHPNQDNIIVIQKTKTSQVPVDRNIISTADNEDSLVASSTVLGTQNFSALEGGTDSPESVAASTNALFFANKMMGKVFRFSGANGIMDISAKGMRSFFRNLFSGLSSNAKIIGGFDPVKEEYLVTVRDDNQYAQNGVSIDQSDEPDQEFQGPGTGQNDDDGAVSLF